MKIGEKDLAFSQARTLDGLRFFDLHDHIRLSENLFDILFNCGARGDIVGIRTPCAEAGTGFNNHFVTGMNKLGHGIRHETHTEFVILDLFWNANQHFTLP